jgi:3D (Asp-Asp-Asp) domain-containing protein
VIRYRLAMQRIIVYVSIVALMACIIVFQAVMVQRQASIIKSLETSMQTQDKRILNLVGEVTRLENVVDVMESEKAISRGSERTVKMLVTAYCPCQICCDKTDGITASGIKAVEGITVAADKRYAFGTQMLIPGFGWRTVQDRGGAIQGNHVDLYFDSHSDALEFGSRVMEVVVK